MYSGIGGMNCMAEISDHQYDQQQQEYEYENNNNRSVLGKRPLLLSSTNAAAKKRLMINSSVSNFNYPIHNFASFTIAFNQNTNEADEEVVMLGSGIEIERESHPSMQVRAKRGYATHPRSIAERNRRSRISERIRRLQELFPNIDKQTSTAEMLDVALEYVRSLHIQVQRLRDARANCKCL